MRRLIQLTLLAACLTTTVGCFVPIYSARTRTANSTIAVHLGRHAFDRRRVGTILVPGLTEPLDSDSDPRRHPLGSPRIERESR